MTVKNLMAPARPCSAHSKQTGRACKQPAIPGGFVCRYHGGNAPQVMDKAKERLAALVWPAIDTLGGLLTNERHPATALGAAKDILDRNKIGTDKEAPTVQVNVLTKVERVIIDPGDRDK